MSQNDAPTTETKTSPEGTQDVSEVVARSIVEDEIADATRVKKAQEPANRKELEAAVAQAVSDMFSVNAWKPRMLVKFKVQCPSGQTALVKHLDTLDLLEHDLIEELDFFTRKLFPVNLDASGAPMDSQDEVETTIWSALADPEKRRRFLDMTGKLMAAASVDPKIVHDGVTIVEKRDKDTGEVTKHTRFGYELKADKQIDAFGKPIPVLPSRAVYSGYIDFADRMTFFQELNKPLELIQPFREEQNAMLQDLARSERDGSEAE